MAGRDPSADGVRVHGRVDWPSFAYAVAGDAELRGPLQAVYHDRRHPSHVPPPVIPRAARRQRGA